jgi:hypothetical protein
VKAPRKEWYIVETVTLEPKLMRFSLSCCRKC